MECQMAVPDYQTYMLPVLQALADSERLRPLDIAQRTADAFNLSAEDRAQLLPSGRAPVFRSRVTWALAYLKQARLVQTLARGVYQLTDRGHEVVKRGLPRIDNHVLEEFEEFRAFLERSRGVGGEPRSIRLPLRSMRAPLLKRPWKTPIRHCGRN